MNSIAIKEKLISSINAVEDEKLLLKMEAVVTALLNQEVAYELTKEQIIIVKEARQQYLNGNVETDEAVNDEDEKWLNQ